MALLRDVGSFELQRLIKSFKISLTLSILSSEMSVLPHARNFTIWATDLTSAFPTYPFIACSRTPPDFPYASGAKNFV